MEKLILVNEKDEITGYGDKMEIHRKGILHRAFSILIFNAENELLLQKRAAGKYHSGGLWTNACCSHPLKDEDTLAAAHRRLREEMGLDCGLNFAFKFIYRVRLDSGLTEHELDHVYTGQYNGPVFPDPGEVSEASWVSMEDVHAGLSEDPGSYTAWFRLIMNRFEKGEVFTNAFKNR